MAGAMCPSRDTLRYQAPKTMFISLGMNIPAGPGGVWSSLFFHGKSWKEVWVFLLVFCFVCVFRLTTCLGFHECQYPDV